MPRQQRRSAPVRSAPTRPTAAPQRASVAPPQNRSATTLAHPPATAAAQRQPAQAGQQQGPGLFGQMASTAAGVAVGSSIGHAIGGFFGGGGSSAPAQAEANQTNATAAYPQDNTYDKNTSMGGAGNCDMDAKQFTKCLDDNQGNMQICGWYLDQLKACQAAARQY